MENDGTKEDTAQAANATDATPVQNRPRPRGFAGMDREKVREIARSGGRAAHARGTAHQFSVEEARVAGQKGGQAPHVRRGRGPGHRRSSDTA